eukprot:TRINITY_DN13105_c0_g1_i1.p2 TRINITY_DN13105_c0_g1~~TRINITY_DN13105_c0_g1_i1.p2  ORF type:complete len:232 (+),score=85.80 TRINITY_DN13105_c0_g1_i1:53-697(+)
MLTDTVLSVTCFTLASSLLSLSSASSLLSSISSHPSGLGFAIIATAAAFGVFRFAGFVAPRPFHHFFTQLSGQVALPLLALPFALNIIRSHAYPAYLPRFYSLHAYPDYLIYQCIIIVLLVSFSIINLVNKKPIEPLTALTGLISNLIILASSYLHLASNPVLSYFGFAGVALLIFSTVVIGPNGYLGGIKRVDIFHILFTVSLYFIYRAIILL